MTLPVPIDLDSLTPREQRDLALDASRSLELHLLALLNHLRHGGSLDGAAGETGLKIALEAAETAQRILERWEHSIVRP